MGRSDLPTSHHDRCARVFGERSATTATVALMRILIVDDHAPTRRLLARNLELASHGVKLAGSCDEARAVLAEGAFDVIVLDVVLPDGSGIELCSRL